MQRRHNLLHSVLLFGFSLVLFSAALADEKSDFEQKHAEEVRQIKQKLERLHSAALSYLKVHQGVWAQCPDAIADSEADDANAKYETWWRKTLEPFGAKKEDWLHAKHPGSHAFQITEFEPERLAAFQYASQPWFVTTHFISPEKVIYMIFPEGNIMAMPFDTDLLPKPGGSIKVRPAKIPDDLKP